MVDDAAGLAWVINLGCIDLNPHPVRAEDLDHPDELRVDLDPVPGVPWSQIRDVALVAREALEAVGLVGWPKTSGSRGIHINVRIEPTLDVPGGAPRGPRARARRRAPRARRSRRASGGRRSATASSSTTTRTRRTAPSRRPTRCGRRPTRGSRCRSAGTRSPTSSRRTSRSRRCPRSTPRRGDAGAGIDDAVGSLEALLELSARHEAEGMGDAPWPPNYAKQAGEPPRVQPSRKRRPDERVRTGSGEAGGPPPEVAAERAAAVAAGDRNAGLPTEWEGTRPTPTGRRKSSIPVIEISRAAKKDEALAGLERWKERHPRRPRHLEPADVLVDGMRGRSTLWYRVRVNLTHVPEQTDRPGAARPRLRPVGELRLEAWRATASTGPRSAEKPRTGRRGPLDGPRSARGRPERRSGPRVNGRPARRVTRRRRSWRSRRDGVSSSWS